MYAEGETGMQRDSNACRGRDIHANGKKCMQREMQACSGTSIHVHGINPCTGDVHTHRLRYADGLAALHVRGHKGIQRDRQDWRWKDRHAEKRTDTHREDGQACSQRTRKKTNSETGRQ
jgi:hypothetical protein